jgi:D-alanyl-D-alanine endopeptidase (penicillin-binding protein 7)
VRFGLIGLCAVALCGAVTLQAQTGTGSRPASTTQTTSTSKTPAPTAKTAATPAPQTRTSLAQSRAAAAARARRAAAARARSAELERQRIERDAMTPHYKRDLLGNQIPDVRAAAAIVFDPQANAVLWEQNGHEPRSVASLTKLMTALTFIADEPNLDQVIAVTSADMRAASTTYLRSGDRVSYRDLLHLSLIASDNAAARVLARTSEGGTAAFITRMNEMAVSLGLSNSTYADPSGLDARNVASAYDTSHLISFVGADPVLGPIIRTVDYTAQPGRAPYVHSTNKLLGEGLWATAWTLAARPDSSRAGYCLATLLRMPQGPQIAVVVLGATNSTVRFWRRATC